MDEHSVRYSEISLALFWILRTSDGSENSLWLTDEIKPYLKIEFVQQNSNWNLEKKDWHKFTTVPAKNCTQEDICKNKECDEE